MENSIIIASCEVTDKAKNKWIKEILKNILEGKKVYLTGCGSIQNGKVVGESIFYSRYPELFLYSEQIVLLPEMPEDFVFEESLGVENGISLRKPIVIQTGCDNFCTFCLTVRKRGKHQNRNIGSILQEIRDFELNGGKEIILTGINLAAWGCENSRNSQESKFSFLLQKILSETSIGRIRISSLGPEYLDDGFFIIVSNTRILPHFHFSVQSFADSVLMNMKRNYNSQVLDYVLKSIKNIYSDKLENEKISIGADIIVGFPGESQKDFEITYRALEKYGITKLHAFPFSPHYKGETVLASSFDEQISQSVKKDRVSSLIKKGDEIRENFILSQKGKEFHVLIEQNKGGLWQGWTENYILFQKDCNCKRGDICKFVL